MARVRDDLTRHVGGTPSVAQKLMIDQAATLTLRLHLMDRAAANDPVASERNARQYLAWANSLTRLLSRLGTAPAPEPAPDLAAYLASRAASTTP